MFAVRLGKVSLSRVCHPQPYRCRLYRRRFFLRREEAIAEATRLARSEEPAKVTVVNGDGTIADEWLFGSDSLTEIGGWTFIPAILRVAV